MKKKLGLFLFAIVCSFMIVSNCFSQPVIYQSAQPITYRGNIGDSLDLPPGAKVGECYTKILVPPSYRTVTEKVLKRPASERVEVIPARYEMRPQKILVKEPSERIAVVPARYRWVEERVMVEEESYQVRTIPARYDWVEEKVLVSAPQPVWKKGKGLIEKIDNATGDIMCLIAQPPQYKTIRKQVLRSPALQKRIDIPAKYKVVKKQILVTPAACKKIIVPAEYQTIQVRKMVVPPQERRIPIPEQYETVTRKVKVNEGSYDWRRVLCETNMGENIIAKVQASLNSAGYYPGPMDGVFGHNTMNALRKYQTAKGLPAIGKLTYETLELLGVMVR